MARNWTNFAIVRVPVHVVIFFAPASLHLSLYGFLHHMSIFLYTCEEICHVTTSRENTKKSCIITKIFTYIQLDLITLEMKMTHNLGDFPRPLLLALEEPAWNAQPNELEPPRKRVALERITQAAQGPGELPSQAVPMMIDSSSSTPSIPTQKTETIATATLRSSTRKTRSQHRPKKIHIEEAGSPPKPQDRLKMLSKKYDNLTWQARDGNFKELVGRDNEVRILLRSLVRVFDMRHVLIEGEAHVGKRTVVQRLAHVMQTIQLPPSLKGKHLIMLDLEKILGEKNWQDLFMDYLEECDALQKQVICVITNLHGIKRKRKSECLKLLAEKMNNGLQVILTSDGSFNLGQLALDSTTSITTVPIKVCRLEDLQKRINKRYVHQEARLRVTICREAAERAFFIAEVEGKKKEMSRGAVYHRACELLDMAVAEARLRYAAMDEEELSEAPLFPYVDRSVVNEVAKMGPVEIRGASHPGEGRLLKIENPREFPNRLRKHVLGQDHAIAEITKAINIASVDLQAEGERGPICQFLFLGTTGVGKTEMARALSKELGFKLLQYNMSEYKEEHSIARLFGPPPGYVGYDEGGQLTNDLTQTPNAVVLFDEVEKAHREVLDAFLQIFEEGTLTDGKGRKTDCSKAIFIMTSNLCAEEITDLFGQGKEPKEVEQLIKEELIQRGIKREWINRLTKYIAFRPISEEVFKVLIPMKLKARFVPITEKQKIGVTWDKSVCNWLRKYAFTPEDGLRPLRQTIQDELIAPLASAMNEGAISVGDKIHYYVEQDRIRLRKV